MDRKERRTHIQVAKLGIAGIALGATIAGIFLITSVMIGATPAVPESEIDIRQDAKENNGLILGDGNTQNFGPSNELFEKTLERNDNLSSSLQSQIDDARRFVQHEIDEFNNLTEEGRHREALSALKQLVARAETDSTLTIDADRLEELCLDGLIMARNIGHAEHMLFFSSRRLEQRPNNVFAAMQKMDALVDVGNYEESVSFGWSFLSDVAPDARCRPPILSKIASGLEHLGQLSAAEDARREAIESVKSNLEERKNLAVEIGHLACNLDKQGRSEEAIVEHHQSIEILGELNLLEKQAVQMGYLALSQMDVCEFVAARETATEALLLLLTNAPSAELRIANAKSTLALTCRMVDDFQTAETLLREALETYQQLGNINETARCEFNLGLVCASVRRNVEARHFFGRAFEMASELENERLMQMVLDELEKL